MKKQLIKEAFRLQQIAGIAPINEIGFENTDQVYDSAIKDALENYAEENYEEGNIESVADVISLMQNDSTLASEVFERALGYVQEKLGNANREDFKAWFSDTAAPVKENIQKETSLSELEDPGFEALIDDLILKIAQNYAEEGEDVEDYMGVAAEDAVELIRRKYRV